MKTFRRFLLASLVVAGLSLPATARADATKEGVFTLGVHMGNANGVLFGLMNSYDTSKKAHPGGVPLLHRQMRWSIDLAKVLKLPTGDLETLDRDLDGLEFSGMNSRLQPILANYRVLLAKIYVPQASHVFDLGVQLTLAGGEVRLALNDRPARQPVWRKMAAGQGGVMASNISGAKLEATYANAPELTTRVNRGDSLESLEAFIGQTLTQWTLDFRKAPAWGVAGGAGVVVAKVSNSLTKSDPADRERKGCFAKVHTVTLNAGTNYVIDLESGDGNKGPGFFDTWLRIEDGSGRTILSNDDAGEGFNARATFRPTATGTYRLVVTSYRTGATGNYFLTVRTTN